MGWGLVDSRIQDAEEYSTAASQERKAASDALEAELAKPEPDYDEVESLNLQITGSSRVLVDWIGFEVEPTAVKEDACAIVGE
jgi:hypothetical protein